MQNVGLAVDALSLVVGQRIGVVFEELDNLFHERLLLARVGRHAWVIATPDGDVYDEDLATMVEVIRLGVRGGLPYSHPGRRIYRFAEEDIVVDSAFRRRCEAEAVDWCRDNGLALYTDPLVPLADGLELPVRADDSVGFVLPRGSDWTVVDGRGVLKDGDRYVGTGEAASLLGDRVLLVFRSMSVVLGTPGSTALVAEPAAVEDLRTLPVRYDPSGKRGRTFFDAVASTTSTPFSDFPVEGPRTLGWLLGRFRDVGMAPMQRHYWWRNVLRLSSADPGVDDHEFLSELLELGPTYDQLNTGELASWERISRRYQLWEERYAEQLKVADAGGHRGSAGDSVEERRLFMGQSNDGGLSLVSPELAKFVAGRLGESAAILKERRKGREERMLLASPTAVVPHPFVPKNSSPARPEPKKGGK